MQATIDHGEAGRVVATVFEPAHAVDQDGHDVIASNCTDDATHGVAILSLVAASRCAQFASSDSVPTPRKEHLPTPWSRRRRSHRADRHRRPELRVGPDVHFVLDYR